MCTSRTGSAPATRSVWPLSGRALAAAHQPGGPAWWTSSGELQTGAHGVAAPVLGLDAVELAIGVISLSPLDDGVVGPAVVRAAGALAVALA